MNSRIIPARNLSIGDVLMFDDDTESSVKVCGYGDAHEHGFVHNGRKLAAPFLIQLDCGTTMKLHPANMVRVKIV